MGTNIAPLVADLFLFCYERDFMMSLSDDKQADVIDAFNTTSRYLVDILNNNVYFDNMVGQIYPSELQLNKANASDTEPISHYKKIGYNINVLQQTACLVVNPIRVGNFAFLFNCMPVGRTSDSMMVQT